jgi:hypothetical protein
MKIAFLLSIVCATAIVSGCNTAENAGGTSEHYEYTSGGIQMEPAVVDPSLPQNPYAGPYVPPPS